MLSLDRLKNIHLSARPRFQRVVGSVLLGPNYRRLPGVEIVLEGEDRLPKEPVIFAMNHTDRYNYWPFQYTMWKRFDRFTATWVKGKYYENPIIGKFMELTNNIPTVSRGYLIARDYLNVVHKPPPSEHYEGLRALVDAQAQGEPLPDAPPGVPAEIFGKARDMLGVAFDPKTQTYAQALNKVFRAMMARFMELNRDAFGLGLDLIIFPQGTRSVRLSRGHIGLAQVALDAKRTVVPVGCNGCDRVYPSGSPIGKKGRIVYRFGDPIRYNDTPEFQLPTFEPFSPDAERTHGPTFQAYVDRVMNQINTLLDPDYQFSTDLSSDGVDGTSRFL